MWTSFTRLEIISEKRNIAVYTCNHFTLNYDLAILTSMHIIYIFRKIHPCAEKSPIFTDTVTNVQASFSV